MMIKRLSIAGAFIIALLLSSISYSQDNFKSFNLKGKISNNLDIHMEIKPSAADISTLDNRLDIRFFSEDVICQYSGFYYYDKYAKRILINGSLYSGGYIQLTEYDEKNNVNGWFRGFIKDNKIIKGVWSSPKGKYYPFYLFDSTKHPEGFDLNVPMDRVGSYDRIDNNQIAQTYLTIYAEGNGKLLFDLDGFYNPGAANPPCPNTGMLAGVASYTDAIRTKANLFYQDNNLKIHFEFAGNRVVVTANDAILNYCGAGVTLDGTFKKIK